MCRKGGASEEVTLQLRPEWKGAPGRGNSWCEGAEARWKKPGLGRWSLALDGTGKMCKIRRHGVIPWPVDGASGEALSEPSGEGRRVRVRGPGPGRRLSE